MVVAAVHRLLAEVVERVVHPAHVPLEVEAQPALGGGSRHRRPGGRLLGGHQHAGLVAVGDLVQLPQEADRLEVLAPAVLVGHPLPGGARVVAVEHRRHGVHAQPVRVVLAQPVEGARHQEVAHLVAPVVEDQRAPVGMGARGAGPRARRGRCRRGARARSRRAGSAPAPSRGSRRCPARAGGRPSRAGRRGSRGWASARSRRSPDSPTSPRTDGPSRAAAPRG